MLQYEKLYLKTERITHASHGFSTPFEPAVINPEQTIEKVADMPAGMIGVFSQKIVNAYVERTGSTQIGAFNSCMGPMPIYRCTLPDGFTFAFVSMPVGGPSATGLLEEAYAMGVQQFLAFGCCGALDHWVTAGHIPCAGGRRARRGHLVPLPAARGGDRAAARLRRRGLRRARGARHAVRPHQDLDDRRHVPRDARQGRKAPAAGLLCRRDGVRSMAAAAEFRGKPFAQFLWAADSLSGEEWDKRILGNFNLENGAIYMEIAVQALRRMAQL